MKSITVEELNQKITSKEDFQLIDIREEHEIAVNSIGGESIRMGEIIHQVDKIRKDCQVVIHCRSGQRSSSVIDALERHHGLNNLYNLEGGIMAYEDKFGSANA